VQLPAMLNEAGQLQVIDLLGQVVYRATLPSGLQRTDLDLGALAEGTYLLDLTSGTDHLVRRIVLQR
ncbi:MAG: T9SS type A sorting domain-containing protein, partial [Flavobacteriales bacterium]|nr:T9SS type A sorting domain-containing protein [Flavobacteriales bacterium]